VIRTYEGLGLHSVTFEPGELQGQILMTLKVPVDDMDCDGHVPILCVQMVFDGPPLITLEVDTRLSDSTPPRVVGAIGSFRMDGKLVRAGGVLQKMWWE
jgi:hypothetical protein